MHGTTDAGGLPYLKDLKDSPSVTLPFVPEWAEPVWHLFVIRHSWRDILQEHLTEAGIGTLIHYPVPPHRSGAYADHKISLNGLPVAEQLSETVLSLPMGPHLTDDQVRFVVNRLTKISRKLDGNGMTPARFPVADLKSN